MSDNLLFIYLVFHLFCLFISAFRHTHAHIDINIWKVVQHFLQLSTHPLLLEQAIPHSLRYLPKENRHISTHWSKSIGQYT